MVVVLIEFVLFALNVIWNAENGFPTVAAPKPSTELGG